MASLHQGDLEHLVDKFIGIDQYKSKIGKDEDVITINLSVDGKDPANDLVNFSEKGYDFVLDSDLAPGEQSDSMYRVFIEIERNQKAPDNIIKLINNLKKLTKIDKFRFRYHKNFQSYEATLENLKNIIPTDKNSYNSSISESTINNYKLFFSKSYLDNIRINGDTLIVEKKYAQPLNFRVINFDNKEAILQNIKESINFNDWAEIIFLTKYLGDYNITKYGNKIIIENNDHALEVQRL